MASTIPDSDPTGADSAARPARQIAIAADLAALIVLATDDPDQGLDDRALAQLAASVGLLRRRFPRAADRPATR